MKPDEAVELLPCPFCGDSPIVNTMLGNAWCKKHTQYIPIKHWNRRALAQPNAAPWKPEDDQNMPSKSSAPPDSGMPEEPPIGHRWASEAMHEYVTSLRAYALSLREELKELQNHHARLAVDWFNAETALEKREGMTHLLEAATAMQVTGASAMHIVELIRAAVLSAEEKEEKL